MPKKFYLPKRDDDLVIWLNNFSSKLSTYSTLLAITSAEVTAAVADAVMFLYLVNLVKTFTTEKAERVQYKNLLAHAPLGSQIGSFPAVPTIPPTPTLVPAGIFVRAAKLAARIKKHPAYTEAIGHDLGIIGAEDTWSPNDMKPVLKLITVGGAVEIQWTKGHADAIRIEKHVGAGVDFSLLTISTKASYTDRTPITEPAVWKYRAIYMLDDELIGQYSDITQITVGTV